MKHGSGGVRFPGSLIHKLGKILNMNNMLN